MTTHRLWNVPRFLAPIAVHYTAALQAHGPQPGAVFWRDTEGQRLRFEQLIGILDDADRAGSLTVNDLGCGYAAMFDFLEDMPFMSDGRYFGYDICEDMVDCAGRRIKDRRAEFQQSLRATRLADYSFVSGTYNLRLDIDDDAWVDYVRASLVDLAAMSRKGLAFNMLAPDRSRRPQKTLYYAEPQPFFDFCRRQLSSRVTLVTDYPLAEWTIWVRL